MNTYRNTHYTITTSLNERAIHLKIVNNTSYMWYEGNFDATAFKLSFDIKDIYELVKNSFDSFTNEGGRKDSTYGLTVSLDNGHLLLAFRCVVGGFLNVVFDLRLREKIMSNDAQLTINFQRIEQTQREEIEKLTSRLERMETMLEALGHANICLTNPPSGRIDGIHSFPISSTNISIIDNHNNISSESFKKIKHFYKLEELHLYGCNWNESHLNTTNASVQKLKLSSCPTFAHISFIKNFPNLRELWMEGIAVNSDFVTTIRSIPHKLTKLTLHSSNINQTEVHSYCTQNNIQLDLK
jgi:hypothetical protein